MPDLTDEAKAEIAAAAGLVRRDFSKATMREVLAEYGLKKVAPEEELDENGKPKLKPPPEKEKENELPAKKKGLWWVAEDDKPAEEGKT